MSARIPYVIVGHKDEVRMTGVKDVSYTTKMYKMYVKSDTITRILSCNLFDACEKNIKL